MRILAQSCGAAKSTSSQKLIVVRDVGHDLLVLRRGYGLGQEYVRGVAEGGVREAVDDGEVTDGCIAGMKVPYWHKSLTCATTAA